MLAQEETAGWQAGLDVLFVLHARIGRRFRRTKA
jgi:hypothetical protein